MTEIEHISDHEQRVWLRRMIEAGEHRRPLSNDQRIALTRDLARISGSPTEAKRLEKIASKFSAGEIEHERLIEELRRGKLRE